MTTASVSVFTGTRSTLYSEQFASPNEAMRWVQAKVNEWRGYEVTTSILRQSPSKR